MSILERCLLILSFLITVTSNDLNCPEKFNFEVEIDQIPTDFKYFQNVGYYKLYQVKQTWTEAWKWCNKKRSNLAVINSEKEAKVLKNLFDSEPVLSKCAYLGFHDLFGDRVFYTINGEFMNTTGYNKWLKPQTIPTADINITTIGSCGVMDRSGLLADVDCTKSLPFFCEYKQDVGPPLKKYEDYKDDFGGDQSLQNSIDRFKKFINDVFGF